MVKTVNVKLNATQIDYLRGIIFEYYKTQNVSYSNQQEIVLHVQLEEILANAENKIYNVT